MKTKIYALSLLVLCSAVAASPAFASLTGSITISGTVAAATAITVSSVSGYNNLDLSAAATDLTVATIKEFNNTANGYTVTLTSQNAGLLKNGSQGSLAYTAKYDANAVSLSSTAVTITNAAASNSVVAATHSLKISYTGQPAANMMVGTYSDTLTFTIAAN